MSEQNSRPVAVLISDIHYNINTLPLADAALRMAIDHACNLGVPVVIAGDLHDTKAVMRAECMNALIHTLAGSHTEVFILPGNHCMVNEKSGEHALEFLAAYSPVILVDKPTLNEWLGTMIPYQSDAGKLEEIIAATAPGSTIICHQGVQTAYMGHYQQDKASLPKEAFAGRRTVSGHYHRRQDIDCGDGGVFSYIGNPYTLGYGEATDPPKGFQVLNEDGTLTFVPTNLRKHVVVERTLDTLYDPIAEFVPGDLVWMKLTGEASLLDKVDKSEVSKRLLQGLPFKLDKISLEKQPRVVTAGLEQTVYDSIIDSLTETPEQKNVLKALWKELSSENT